MRKDIQGLRALAVISVVAFHAQVPLFSRGYLGVDVFFVISGYLIIGLLLKEMQLTETVNVVKFLARRARRLIPAASVVLFATILATLVLMPGLSGRRVFTDVQSASVYVANLHFGFTATDYWAHHAISPVLHFWSLGVEEQFYLFFPLALFGLSSLKMHPRQLFRASGLSLAVIATLSGVFLGRINSPEWAFYNPICRVWEFAIGGLAVVASMTLAKHPIHNRSQKILGLGSLALATVIAWWLTDFYNPWSQNSGEILAIVLATACALLIGSLALPRLSLEGLSSLGVIQWLGKISYSVYLWHWPVLFFGLKVLVPNSGKMGDLGPVEVVILVIVTLVLADLTYKMVENPVRNSLQLVHSSKRSLLLGLALSLFIVGSAQAASVFAPVRLDSRPIENVDSAPNVPDLNEKSVAQLIARESPKMTGTDGSPITARSLELAADDFPATNADGCFISGSRSTGFRNCVYGEGNELIALVGSSHANQFFSPVRHVTQVRNARLLVHTRSGCTLADVDYALDGKTWSECNAWKQRVLADLLVRHPDLVIMVTRFQSVIDPATDAVASQSRQTELFVQGIQRTVESLTSVGIRVLIIRDTPRLAHDPVDCLSSHIVPSCQQSLSAALQLSAAKVMEFNGLSRALSVDLSQAICSGKICPAVRAGQVVWRDSDHVTDTYAKSLSPLFVHLVEMSLQR